MTDNKHTPGPWETDQNNVHPGHIATIDCRLSSDQVLIWSQNWPKDDAERKANARLIAAAPDLLDALEELLAHANFMGIEVHYERIASAAIAKARGRE